MILKVVLTLAIVKNADALRGQRPSLWHQDYRVLANHRRCKPSTGTSNLVLRSTSTSTPSANFESKVERREVDKKIIALALPAM